MDGKKGGLSPKTIRNHHMILKDFFTYAIGKYKLPVNPTLSTTRPEVVQKEMRVLSPDEMQVFMEEVMKETQRIAILTDLFLGLRMGELLALQISDLNLQRQTLTVNKNLIRVNTESLSLDNPNIKILSYNPAKKTHLIVQNTPKTKSSNREIAISMGCVNCWYGTSSRCRTPVGLIPTICCSHPRPGPTSIPRVFNSG